MRLRPFEFRRLFLACSGALGAALLSQCSGSAAKIGSACARDADCGAGPGAVCLTSAIVYADGYCSRFCDHDADCAPEAFCEASTGNGLCVATCASNADCRVGDGYDCYAPDEDAGRMACLPTYPALDGGAADAGSNDGG